jgi:aspartate aminotransferase
MKEMEGLDYGPNEILVASGGRPLIYAVFRAICDKGDKVIYAVPSWNNNHYTHFVGGQHVEVEAKLENNFMPSADDIRPYVKDATLIALCSPQNPTGTTFRKAELAAICDLVLEENKRRGENEKKTIPDVRSDVLAFDLRRHQALRSRESASWYAGLHNLY